MPIATDRSQKETVLYNSLGDLFSAPKKSDLLDMHLMGLSDSPGDKGRTVGGCFLLSLKLGEYCLERT